MGLLQYGIVHAVQTGRRRERRRGAPIPRRRPAGGAPMPKKIMRGARRSHSADGGLHRNPRLVTALVALAVLTVAVGIALGLGPNAARARGEEAGGASEILGATAE